MYSVFTFQFECEAKSVCNFLALRRISFLRNSLGDLKKICISKTDMAFISDVSVSFDLRINSLVCCEIIPEEFAPAKLP